MSNLAFMEGLLNRSSPEQVHSSLASLLPQNATTAEKISAIEGALRSPAGRLLRAELGKLIVEKFVPVEALVPLEYENWRPPVRDAMLYVVSHLSDARLAPKLLEQIELPPNTPPETRLLRLIAKIPGLQKLGQVIARNRYLRPSLRVALSQLENGIRDVSAEEMCAIIRQELGAKIESFAVDIEPSILSEASVSAVLRFSWNDPKTGERRRGVFKALKSYIPACFAEDMELLQGLANFFGSKHREYGLEKNVLTDTFTKVRRLLQHEVHFVGEQKTLVEASALYGSLPRVRVPQIYQALCTSKVTAMSEEHGEKVTEAVARMPARRRGQVAQQLIETLIAVPLFAPQENALFHADPHAGNLFYDNQTGELIILDWALTERLSREQRRHLALLVLMVGLRDPIGACGEIQALSQGGAVRRHSKQAKIIRETVADFFESLPLKWVPGAVDAMGLLQRTAAKGIRFASSLIMLSKVLFTLDGVIADIRGSGVSMAYAVARHGLQSWLTIGSKAGLPLTLRDLMKVQCSAMLYSGRLSIKLEQTMLDKLLPCVSAQ
jgi:predicted unusual protein kinase regulating ubiquinone biosynthesis (AarF/ABC1/UbiB family)